MKKNLNDIKSKTKYVRGPVKRHRVRALKGESAKRAIGDLEPGCEVFGFTKGQFSLIDLLEHVLTCTGPAHVFVATWSAADADLKQAFKFLKNGRVQSLRFLVDYSFRARQPDLVDTLLAVFGRDAVRVSVTHAKFCLIYNDDWSLVVRTSMNLNFNPRFENFEISDDREFLDFQMAIIDEIWNSPKAAEGFDVPHKDNYNEFKKTFIDTGGLFQKDLPDGRDLI